MKNSNFLKNLINKFNNYNHPNYLNKLIELDANISKLKPAAILIPLSIDTKSQLSFTFTRRSQNLRYFKGECCFIGGYVDKEDKCALNTAMREAFEEVGMNKHCLNILCHFKPIFTSHGSIVTPIVALLDQTKFTQNLNHQEVDLIFKVPTNVFLEKDFHYLTESKYKNDTFFMHYFKWQHEGEKCLITGITSTLAILIASIIHSQLPKFQFAPDINLELNKLDNYLDHLNLVNGKQFINDFAKKN